MPLPLIAGVVRCAVQGTVASGQRWVNVWHAQYAAGASSPGASDIAALDALLVRAYQGTIFAGGLPWLNSCPSGTKLAQISYTPLDGISLTTTIPHVASGSGGGNSSPSECAPVLTLRTAKRGRSNRGRVYMPAPSASIIQADGTLSAAVAAQLVAQVQGIMGALGGNAGPPVAPFWTLGVASYLHSHYEPLALPTMDTAVDVQRRRKL